MGDRGNIVVLQSGYKKEDNDQIWLYTHWGGSETPNELKKALAECPGRWRDDTYLARIILMRMVPESMHHEETGWAISTRITDNEHKILVVDAPNQRVFLMDQDDLVAGRVPKEFEPDGRVWSFEAFSKLQKLPVV